MRLMITGAAGFLGSHLCDRLVADAHDVVGVDNFTTGERDNIAQVIGSDHFEFLEYNTAQYTYVPGPLDGILHFAQPAMLLDYQNRPLDSLGETPLSVQRTLELARQKEARYLLASSCEVYGDSTVAPQVESDPGVVDPVSPRGIYSEGKRFAESLTAAYHSHHGLETRIVRIFNVYGPRMRAEGGSAIANFVIQALRSEPLTIYGDGSQTRSFCFVDDMVEGINRLFFSDHVEPVNLGGDEALTIRELAQLVIEITESASEIVHLPLPGGDVRSRLPDVSRARQVLGWKPRTSLREGLSRTIPDLKVKVDRQGATARTPTSITGFL